MVLFVDDDNARLFELFSKPGTALQFPNPTLFVGSLHSEGFMVTADSDTYTVARGPPTYTWDLTTAARSRCVDAGKCLDFYSGPGVFDREDLAAALKACAGKRDEQQCRALYANIEPVQIEYVKEGKGSGCEVGPCAKPECFTRDRAALSLEALRAMAGCHITRDLFHVGTHRVDNTSSVELVGSAEDERVVSTIGAHVDLTGVAFAGCTLIVLLLARSLINTEIILT